MWKVARRFVGPSVLVAGTIAAISHSFQDSPSIARCDSTVVSGMGASNGTTNVDKYSNASQHKNHNDCENPVCKSTSDMFRKALKGAATPTTSGSSSSAGSETHPSPTGRIVCPLDRDSLGREAWDVIHTVAAYYPEDPSPEQQAAAEGFIRGLAVIYPCAVCAADFQQSLIDNPPRVTSRQEFVLWCCELHNRVNRNVGKSGVPCDLAQLDRLWRTGLPECGTVNTDLQHAHE